MSSNASTCAWHTEEDLCNPRRSLSRNGCERPTACLDLELKCITDDKKFITAFAGS